MFVAICGTAFVPAPAQAAATSITIYIAPKVNQPGAMPAASSSAAALGTAVVKNDRCHRQVQVQKSTNGGSWVNLGSAKTPGSDRTVEFRGWGQDRYRARLPGVGSCSAYASPVKSYSWRTTFLDEFSGSKLDANKWSIRGDQYSASSKSTRAKASSSAVSVHGGVASFKVLKDPEKPGYWLNGHVGTQNSYTFTYGWAAARVRFQRFNGSHSAFWLQSPNGYVPNTMETDVAEYHGSDNPNNTRGTSLAYQNYTNWSGTGMRKDGGILNDVEVLGKTDRWWNSYHVYSVRWLPPTNSKPAEVRGFVDDKRVYTLNVQVSTTPEFLVLSMLTRDYEIAQMHTGRMDTYSMDVDWVEVFQE